MEKIIAYDFFKTEEKLRGISTAPDLIVFHSLTNEMVENSVEQLCRQNQRNNSDCFGFIPRYKSCVIRSDSKIR